MLHRCSLPGAFRTNDSETHLPPNLPGTPLYARLLKLLRSTLLVSPKHPETRNYYRSRTKISAENERLVHQLPPFIVHPFSVFRKCWELVVFIALTLHLLTLAFLVSFAINLDRSTLLLLQLFDILLCLLLALEFLLQLVTGYVDEGEIVLELGKIVRHRLRCWTIGNQVLLFVPYVLVLDELVVAFYQDSVLVYLCLLVYLYLLCVWRFRSVNAYFDTFAKGWLNLSHKQLSFIKPILSTLYVLHWTACLLYIAPMLALSILREDQDEAHLLVDVLWTYDQHRDASLYPISHRNRLEIDDVWHYLGERLGRQLLEEENETDSRAFLQAKLDDVHYNVSVAYRYLRALMITLKVGLQGGHSLSVGHHFLHEWIQSLLLLGGWIWSTYILLLLIRSIMMEDASSTQYDEVLNEIDAFCKKKRLSRAQHRKLCRHFAYHYRMHYFDERAVLAHASGNLRRQVLLDVTQSACLNRSEIFRDLPAYLLEDITERLRFELFLEQDTITTAGSTADAMYFLACGTAAVYTPDGVELGHLVDGSNFGAVALFRRDARHTVTVVTLEVCEVYWLERTDFQQLMKPHPYLWAQMVKQAEKRMKEAGLYASTSSEEQYYDTFLY
ncbi:potassium/sodium hyperpolarization-activated cyclic nucleotide-gated channel 1-like [Anopheles albimanus]|uniref:potassium/sodium hyperpolarization-activated cyclic nucleotide-gated channel 1-like n=1 Tax=Anopheles albimanus TaxID=7167 RepID=UPI00164183C7|nr:potassium/sodium hyperpolarization-activated cyclic nucleotide-gated channel 1-like [Anopheles albimanus]